MKTRRLDLTSNTNRTDFMARYWAMHAERPDAVDERTAIAQLFNPTAEEVDALDRMLDERMLPSERASLRACNHNLIIQRSAALYRAFSTREEAPTHSEVITQLEEVSTSAKALTNALERLSPHALQFIATLKACIKSDPHPRLEHPLSQCLRGDSIIGDDGSLGFRELRNQLQGLATCFQLTENAVQLSKQRSPGAKTIDEQTSTSWARPIEMLLTTLLGSLRGVGRPDKHAIPIGKVIHEWATGEPAVDNWGKREVVVAKRMLRTNPA